MQLDTISSTRANSESSSEELHRRHVINNIKGTISAGYLKGKFNLKIVCLQTGRDDKLTAFGSRHERFVYIRCLYLSGSIRLVLFIDGGCFPIICLASISSKKISIYYFNKSKLTDWLIAIYTLLLHLYKSRVDFSYVTNHIIVNDTQNQVVNNDVFGILIPNKKPPFISSASTQLHFIPNNWWSKTKRKLTELSTFWMAAIYTRLSLVLSFCIERFHLVYDYMEHQKTSNGVDNRITPSQKLSCDRLGSKQRSGVVNYPCSKVKKIPTIVSFSKTLFLNIPTYFPLLKLFIYFFLLPLGVTMTPENCLHSCNCSSYSFPHQVATSSNVWPSILTASLMSEVYPVPFKMANDSGTIVDTLLFSPADNKVSSGEERKTSKHLPSSYLKNQMDYFSSVDVRNRLPLYPGEVFVNCDAQNVSSLSTLVTTEELDVSNIVKIDLSNNNIKAVYNRDLNHFSALRYLFLNNNSISIIEKGSLPWHLVHLSVRNNLIDDISPVFRSLLELKILDLAGNSIGNLTEYSISSLPNLVLLSFHRNRILQMDNFSLFDLPSLQILDLAENKLRKVPEAIKNCKKLRQLLLGENQISNINGNDFSGLVNLEWVDLQKNPLLNVHYHAFSHLPSLVKMILDSTRKLKSIPDLNGTHSLELLRIGRASLESVPTNLCQNANKLRSLYLPLNKIKNLPDLTYCGNLRLLGLSNNEISSLGERKFIGVPLLHDLHLQYNQIEHIPMNAFLGLNNLQVLNMEFNKISSIAPKSFLPFLSLEDINLGNNVFPELPSVGLEHVVNLKVHNNKYLRVFPGPDSFPAVHSLYLSYAYHCCPFLSIHGTETYDSSTKVQERVIFTMEQLRDFDPDIWNQSHVWPHMKGIPTSEFINVWANSDDATPLANILGAAANTDWTPDTTTMSTFNNTNVNGTRVLKMNVTGGFNVHRSYTIQCIPQPGPFMPCRDLFDWWTLRCGVWLVFLLALMGNGVVVVVLASAYSKMDVPRFLVTNLALADFFMGIYLGFLAVVDASTLGDFRMYAIPWQLSVGCQLAGFLGVLSSELSVYTLAVITMERNYAITHAMHLNKRLSLKHAAYIMFIGWIFSISMAVLPLTGVSDYRKFAVCLPFETAGAGLSYVVFLMVINGVAFFILMCCYLKIYCAIRGSQAWNSNDSRIAKRMALLVFTDFICWAPIAFFALSAAFGWQLISLEEAKVFTVFVLPLNSCCNPFLYALLTKQFKKDCVMLCKAIEESRVTRGIGRCRHSSNFSNRQTPANTNSALEQNSKEDNYTCSCHQTEYKGKNVHVAARAIRYLCCHQKPPRSISSGKSSNKVSRSPLKVARAANSGHEKSEAPWHWKGSSASTLRLLELRRQTTMDLDRKSSQESSLSSSRNDSSGTSGSTVTWRISRSSVSSDTSSSGIRGQRGSGSEKGKDDNESQKLHSASGGRIGLHSFMKPRLERQRAIDKDPGIMSLVSELRCPLHARGDNLSCVYEQASLEEEDSNDVFVSNQQTCLTHKRSLSDGILCGALLSLSAPTPQIVPQIATKFPLSRSFQHKERKPRSLSGSCDAKIDRSAEVTRTDDNSKPNRLLETHFPIDDEVTEVDPLLRRKSS